MFLVESKDGADIGFGSRLDSPFNPHFLAYPTNLSLN